MSEPRGLEDPLVEHRKPVSGQRARYGRLLATSAGLAFGVLVVVVYAYSETRWGDDLPFLMIDGTAGVIAGWLTPIVPVVTGWLAWRYFNALPNWMWATLLAAVLVVIVLFPEQIDCGDSLRGFTCAGNAR